jgi:hypothetical protein
MTVMELSTDPRAWTAASVDTADTWYTPLPGCLQALKPMQDSATVTNAKLAPAERSACRRDLATALYALEHGRGFVVVTCDPLSPALRTLYWLVGQALGEPVEQNVEGVLLYDVRDTGAALSEGARFSVTSYESSFHTDNSFGATIADYVGLLCVRPAQSGGVSQLVSGRTVCRILQERHPDEFTVLRQPFHVDRRGGARPGEAPAVRQPVITMADDGPVFRYLRYWIEAGHQKAGEPLTPAQVAALDTLDEVASRPDLRVEFTMKPGDMLFINNRWLLHNRTAFVDSRAPAERRHLVRLWLQALSAPGT